MVTLGIIGVVAALTVPSLMQNWQKDAYTTQLHKVYTELSQAAIKATNDSNAISLDETDYVCTNEHGAEEFIKKYFKVVKSCGTDLTPCFASSYKNIDGTDFELETPEYVATIASGASISVWYNSLGSADCGLADFGYGDDNNHGYMQLQVDTNGAQWPNRVGRDLFYMELYSDGKVSETYNGDIKWQAEACTDGGFGYGVGCLSRIIQDGWRMTY